MEKPVVFLAWLAIPLAAGAGYFCGRAGQQAVGKSTAARQKAAAAIPASSTVSKWAQRLEKCSAAELPGIFVEINAIKDEDTKKTALKLLCARWLEVDGPGGVAFFVKIRQDRSDPLNASHPGLTYLLIEWALRDPDGAYETAKALGAVAEMDLYRAGKQLLYEDPEKFWKWFQKARQPSPLEEDGAWLPVMAAHFEELQAMAPELIGTGKRTDASAFYRMLAATLASKDASKALEWARTVPEDVRHYAWMGAINVLAGKQPESVLEYLPLLKPSSGANVRGNPVEEILSVAMNSMVARDPLTALEWTVKHQEEFRAFTKEANKILAGALSAAMRDGKLTPEQAFDTVRGLGEDAKAVRSDLLRNMWGALPADQLSAAATWLKALDRSDPSRSAAVSGVLAVWEWKDSKAAFAFANQLDEPSVASGFYTRLLFNRNRAGGTPESQTNQIVDAITRVPPERRSDIIEEHLRLRYGPAGMERPDPSFDGPRFAALLADVPASEPRDSAAMALATKWAGTDPLSALEWSAQQTDPRLRRYVTGGAIAGWAKQDEWGASEWVKAQPQGAERDTATARLVDVLRTTDPESAWVWAADINDPGGRLGAQANVLDKWRDSAPVEAQAAMESISPSLAPADRQRLLDIIAPREIAK